MVGGTVSLRRSFQNSVFLTKLQSLYVDSCTTGTNKLCEYCNVDESIEKGFCEYHNAKEIVESTTIFLRYDCM
jgi:hypothetical protein